MTLIEEPITLIDEPEIDPEQILAERRRKRAEILAKYASNSNTPAQSEGGQTPTLGTGTGTPAETGTPGRKEVELAAKALKLGSESPVAAGSTGGADEGAFDLFKDEASNEAIRISDQGSSADKDVSAADYNPDEDRKRDDRRQAEREGATGPPPPPSAMETVTVQDDDDDDDDMFAVGLKPVVVDDGPPKPTFIPVINRSLDGASGLTDNYDDEEGYYKIVLGELLDNGRYHVHANLGKGMFSGVVRAKDMESTTGAEVAIKVIRSQESMYKAGMKEANILRKLQEADPTDKKHLIRLERTFDHRGHLCLVFESLSMNLREVVKRYGKDVGINLRAVRAYASQMFLGLALMKKCEIMHADIKPDNILVNESKSVLKICDLGSASDLSENDITPYLCSRFYRAPEIILGLPYDCALDTWSIGCTLYELYTGKILFPGRTNNHMLALIMELKGKLTHKMIKKARFGEQHFDDSMNFISVEKNDTTKLVAIPSRATNDLKARLMSPSAMKKLKEDEVKLVGHFIDLLDKMLSLDPAKRPTPKSRTTTVDLRQQGTAMDYSDGGSPGGAGPYAPRPLQPSQQQAPYHGQGRDDSPEQYSHGNGNGNGNGNGGGGQHYNGAGSDAAALALAGAKGRSAIACVLCRRLMSVEDRLATLESDNTHGVALSRQGRGSPAQEHEHRIAQLEAQIYSLQLAANNPQLSRSLPASSLPSSYLRSQGHGPPPGPNPYSFPSHLQNPQPLAPFSGNSSPYPSQPPPQHQVSAPYPSYPPAGRHTFPSGRFDAGFLDGGSPAPSASSNGDSVAGREPPPPDSGRGEKRWKGEGDVVDFITRGEVTVEEATLCFDSYFLNYNLLNPSTPSLSLPIHLPFPETRQASALLLATIVFIGARALSHYETSALALAEALRLCHYTFVPEQPPNAIDFKAITLLSLYTGMEDLQAHAVAMAFELGLPTALLRYDRLSEEDKAGKEGASLIVNGRAFLISHMWTAFYTYNRGKPGSFHISTEVLRHQVDVLERSVHTQQPTDRLIRVEVEACVIMRAVYGELGPGQRIKEVTPDELSTIIGNAALELEQWSRRWLDMMELVCTWGDNKEFKTAVPFHHNRMNLMMWIFRDLTPDSAPTFPRVREFAKMAADSALQILRFGVESRIWLPHSMVGQYLLHCKYVNPLPSPLTRHLLITRSVPAGIPTCLYTLSLTSRLFPEDANFPIIRRLLHRLLTQCDEQLRALTGTCRELARARITREAVLELDRIGSARWARSAFSTMEFPGVVTGKNLIKLMDYAREKHNVTSSSTVVAALEGARDVNAPVILQVSQGGAAFFGGKGLKNGNQEGSIAGAVAAAHYIRAIAPSYGIPVVIHSDHCAKKLLPWFDGMLAADEAYFKKEGEPLFSSHMLDLSEESKEENIATCVKYFKRMAPIDLWLEMEIGITGGEEDGVDNTGVDNASLYTQPEDILEIHQALSAISPAFSIAAAFGNVHGVYKPGNVKLQPELLAKHQKYCHEQLKSANPLPIYLVFHGGSGSTKEEISTAVENGCVKMNVDTDAQWAYMTGFRDYFGKKKDYLATQVGNPEKPDGPNKKYYDPRVWVREGELTMRERVKEACTDLRNVNIL
ncbi:hypothetical protein RQP46_000931 [Phenoliferia psychrophenolica]